MADIRKGVNFTIYYPNVKVKKLSDTAKIPTKNNFGDAGFDLYADQDATLLPGQQQLISTSIALEIPSNNVGLIWPRSGLSVKQGIDVLAGVIDCTYRGEIKVCLLSQTDYKISKGDKIAQILIQRIDSYEMFEVESLSDSYRGEKGFGSSGI
jgi:dUTP pyrophosphatase